MKGLADNKRTLYYSFVRLDIQKLRHVMFKTTHLLITVANEIWQKYKECNHWVSWFVEHVPRISSCYCSQYFDNNICDQSMNCVPEGKREAASVPDGA
ncbi:hypothetical protein CEXT_656051 [Caerostris extrusa]|uniref:Uncharacterized protein n=1 Tax=Caerostris extrusa TaxID=172846 RepID=A0AAV4P708_CAEEX|nr:hypothetical protein CEXT_656051 [Caerostris extrusa]